MVNVVSVLIYMLDNACSKGTWCYFKVSYLNLKDKKGSNSSCCGISHQNMYYKSEKLSIQKFTYIFNVS